MNKTLSFLCIAFAASSYAQDTTLRLNSRQVLTIKATGESVLLVKSGKETNGEYAEFIVTLPAGASGPPLHRHPLQSEYFEAIEGKVGLMADGQKMVLTSGQSFTVLPGVKHTFFNAGATTMKWKVIVKPALSFEYLADEMIAAVNRSYPRKPDAYEMAYILSQIKGEYYYAEVPMFRQKVLWPVKAWWGKLTGKTKQVRPNTTL